jgi:hypothetical protein
MHNIAKCYNLAVPFIVIYQGNLWVFSKKVTLCIYKHTFKRMAFVWCNCTQENQLMLMPYFSYYDKRKISFYASIDLTTKKVFI